MTKTCAIISANLGGYEPPADWVRQQAPEGWAVEVHRFTDANFPPRAKAMTPSLQAGILKMFGWEFVPGFDAYIWVDASRQITSPHFAEWMLDELAGAEFAVFLHPQRRTIREEYEFVKAKLAAGSRYLLKRYAGEWLDEQVAAICDVENFKDRALYASTSFAYRPTESVKAALKEWWFHKSRYLLHDQLALPLVLWMHGVFVRPIAADIYDLPLWRYVRK